MTVSDELKKIAADPRPKRLPLDSKVLFPSFGSEVPQLKQMLIDSSPAQLQLWRT